MEKADIWSPKLIFQRFFKLIYHQFQSWRSLTMYVCIKGCQYKIYKERKGKIKRKLACSFHHHIKHICVQMHWIALRPTKRVSIIHKSNLTFYALHNPAPCITS